MRPGILIPGKEVEPAPVKSSREEGRKPISVPSSDGDIRVTPVVPPKQGPEAPNLVTSKDGVMQPAANRCSREEEFRTILATLADSLLVRQSIGEGPSTRDDGDWGPGFFDWEEESDSPTV